MSPDPSPHRSEGAADVTATVQAFAGAASKPLTDPASSAPVARSRSPFQQRLLPRIVLTLALAAGLSLGAAGLLLVSLPEHPVDAALALTATALLFVLLGSFGVLRLVRRQVLDTVVALQAVAQQTERPDPSGRRWQASGIVEFDDLARRLVGLNDELRTLRRGLDYVVNHDTLTGLGNRRHLGEQLAMALNRVRNQPDHPISLMLVDVDGFKLINDGLGHAAGDAALCEVSKRLRGLLRPDDTLARLGGDEFALLMSNLHARDAGNLFDKLRSTVAMPMRLDQRAVNLHVSAGIAEGVAGMTAHDWQRRADLALAAAKREGRNRMVVFRDALQSDAAHKLKLEHALRLAIANDDLDVWYQPIVDGSNGHVLGIEALCRWTHDGDPVAPLEFIRLAETSGLIVSLGRSVLRAACRTLAGLRKRHPALRCSVNLSVGQFVDGDIENELLEATRAAGLTLGALQLEITESLVATHESGVGTAMQRLVERGAEFCLDDFGTGFSSLDRLRQLPIKTLKIHRSFVTPLQGGDEVIVRHIHLLCRELGLHSIAEGVEHEAERRALCEIGCTAMQGYLLARPMPATDLSRWLEHRVVRG